MVVISAKFSQSSSKHIHKTNPHLRSTQGASGLVAHRLLLRNQPTAKKLTCLEKRQTRLAGRPQPHPRAAAVAPRAGHLVAAVRLLRVRPGLRARGLDVCRLHEKVGRVPLCVCAGALAPRGDI